LIKTHFVWFKSCQIQSNSEHKRLSLSLHSVPGEDVHMQTKIPLPPHCLLTLQTMAKVPIFPLNYLKEKKVLGKVSNNLSTKTQNTKKKTCFNY